MTNDGRGSQPPYRQDESRPPQGRGYGERGYQNQTGIPAQEPPDTFPYAPHDPPPQSHPYAPNRPPALDRHEQQSAQTTAQRPGWLTPVIVVALVLVVLGAVGGVVYTIGKNALQEPMTLTSTFCNDMKAQNYAGAYKLLSSGYQARVTSQQFTDASQIHDQLDGKVKQCGLAALQDNAGFNLNLSPENASFKAQITRNRTYTGAVTLVKQNGSWKIDTLDDALQGSDIGALATGALFCQALSKQDYAAVYALFTPAYQQQIGSVAKYVSGLKQVFGDGQFQITGCQPQVSTFSVTAQDDSAAVSGAFNIKVATDAGTLTVPVPYKMSFAKISGAWKISDLEVVQSQG